MLDQVEAALAGWTGAAHVGRVPALPDPEPGALLVVDRPGSVQSSLRMGGLAVPRADERYPALQLANLIFGGYFSSRWVENIREDKGYTYGPHSRIEHNVLGSSLLFDVEVATEVTAPALLETLYELGKIASLPVTEAEVDSVRQYAIGSLALSTATQAGLASTLSALAAFGLGLDWVIEHPHRLAAVGVDEVSAAAAEFLAPARLTSVVVGDAAHDHRAARRAGPGDHRAVNPAQGPLLSRAGYDRAAHRRTDPDWLARAWPGRAGTGHQPEVHNARHGGRRRYAAAGVPRCVRHRRTTSRADSSGSSTTCPTSPSRSNPTVTAGCTLRDLGPTIDDLDAGLLTSAIALEQWHQRHTALPAVRGAHGRDATAAGPGPAPTTAASTTRAPTRP